MPSWSGANFHQLAGRDRIQISPAARSAQHTSEDSPAQPQRLPSARPSTATFSTAFSGLRVSQADAPERPERSLSHPRVDGRAFDIRGADLISTRQVGLVIFRMRPFEFRFCAGSATRSVVIRSVFGRGLLYSLLPQPLQLTWRCVCGVARLVLHCGSQRGVQ